MTRDQQRSQRWRERRSMFVKSGDPIDPRSYHVDFLDGEAIARRFVADHHYAKTLPPMILGCGLYEGGTLKGVACFTVPMNNRSITLHTGLSPEKGCELGRLVLLDEVPGNGESWFLARAMRLLRERKPEIEAIISYSDPVVRRDKNGRVFMPGHVGEVYQALNAQCRGRGTARTLRLMPDGTTMSERTLAKIRGGERGRDYGVRQLRDAGAPPPRTGESDRDWLARLDREGFFVRRRHPGNWAYSFALTRKARRIAAERQAVGYPRRDRSLRDGDVSLLPLLGAPPRIEAETMEASGRLPDAIPIAA